jgi:hypothetical protein
MKILTVEFSELVIVTAPMVLFEPFTSRRTDDSPDPTTDPPTKVLPYP